MKRNKSRHILSVLLLIAILSITLSGIFVVSLCQKAYDINVDNQKNYQTVRAANQIMISINEASLSVATLLLTNDSQTIKNLPATIISVQLNTKTLHQLILDDKLELNLYDKLMPLIEEKIALLQNIISHYNSDDKPAALKLMADNNELILMNKIRQLIILIKKIEMGQIDQLTPIYHLKNNNAQRLCILTVFINIFWLIFIYVLLKRNDD